MTSADVTATINLYSHQQEAIKKLKNGSILVGGVGTGKSLTALTYYWERVLEQKLTGPPLYIITTARKRDTKDWEKEAAPFPFSFCVDSWNNIQKYKDIRNAFFLFDEQRVVGYGKWSKAFIQIAKQNQWILLTATPGDTWTDYIPVFIANGFYRNKTDFIDQHVVYSRYSKFPKVDRYVNVGKLLRERKDIVVNMQFEKQTVAHNETVWVLFDKDQIKRITSTRWDPFKDIPIRDAAGLCYALRKAVNSHASRIDAVKELVGLHPKSIIFYNFDYELELLRKLASKMDICCREWNGHKHELIPDCDRWIYLVQYTAGAEGWNCTQTDTMIFYSQNYSYKIMTQAAGRIDRMNTPFTHLYYYHLCSRAGIDIAIQRAIRQKRNFNETLFAERNP